MAWSALLTLCVLFWVTVTGCVWSDADTPTVFDDLTSAAVHQEDVSPLLALRFMKAAQDQPSQPATVHVRHMPELASVKGGLPIVGKPTTRPIPGEPFVLHWMTRAVPPRPNLSTALLISLDEPEAAQPIPGARGSMLQVPPDFVLIPDRVGSFDDDNGGLAGPFRFVQDSHGAVVLQMTWPSQLAGITVWCQLLVEDNRVAAGCVSTPMVVVRVGSQ